MNVMRPATPYAGDLRDLDPLDALRRTPERIGAIAGSWSPAAFERSYAIGRWTARQLLTHLAQCELVFGTRVRLALVTPSYVAQDMDQDAWMARESHLSGPDALAAFVAVSRMNLALFESLSPADRAVRLSHPEYGPISVDWIIHQMAGHQIHHLKQLEKVR